MTQMIHRIPSLLTLRCRIILDKSTVVHLITEFLAVSGARRLIEVLRKANLFRTVATHTLKIHRTKRVGVSGNVCDLHSRDDRFHSQPPHRVSTLWASICPDECSFSVSNWTVTAFFQILSDTVFIDYPIIRCYANWANRSLQRNHNILIRIYCSLKLSPKVSYSFRDILFTYPLFNAWDVLPSSSTLI